MDTCSAPGCDTEFGFDTAGFGDPDPGETAISVEWNDPEEPDFMTCISRSFCSLACLQHDVESDDDGTTPAWVVGEDDELAADGGSE